MLTKTFFSLLLLAASGATVGEATVLPTKETRVGPDPQAEGGILRNSKITWFHPGLGACGLYNGDGDIVAALSYADFDPHTPNGNPNRNTQCGRRVRISYQGRITDVAIVDRCPGCPPGGLDLSPSAFQRLADLGIGVIYGEWRWV
ncbi:hypothetical protein VTJ83DRAFT_6098 [Remersonia thermophila]|uniref:RlpA-like protein double-psi beta-barrel domain-containing protein n=1 Tax=Remersonia thermophila TaxID=72144 RepID=A0ABR4D8U4_9PEZI